MSRRKKSKPLTREPDKYADFVEHPRYGRRPRITGLNLSPNDPGVHLHWNVIKHHELIAQYEAAMGEKWPYGEAWSDADRAHRIPNTAIVADLARQMPATVAVTHYFDLARTCHDCRRPFIFFAAEQKHWYEELGLGLESDCVRCVECRKRQQGIARDRETYETLFHVPDRSSEQSLEMAEACLRLTESGVFASKQTERVRMLLNAVAADSDADIQLRRADALKRVLAAEEKRDA